MTTVAIVAIIVTALVVGIGAYTLGKYHGWRDGYDTARKLDSEARSREEMEFSA